MALFSSSDFAGAFEDPIKKALSQTGNLIDNVFDDLLKRGKFDLDRFSDDFKQLLKKTGDDIRNNLEDELKKPIKTLLDDFKKTLFTSLGIPLSSTAGSGGAIAGSGVASSGGRSGATTGTGNGFSILGGLAALIGIGLNAAEVGSLSPGGALSAAGLLGFGSVFGGTPPATGTLGGFVNNIGGAFGLFNPGASATEAAAAFSATSLAEALGFAGLGFAGGGLLANLVGLNPTGGAIGGAIGAGLGGIAGGSAQLGTILGIGGGPLGAILGGVAGSLIGGLFGGGKSVGPAVAAQLGLSGGRFTAVGFGKDNGATLSQAQEFGRGFTQNLNAILDLTQSGVAAGGALPTQTQREGFFLDEPTRRHFGQGASGAAAMMKFILLNRTSGLTAEERTIIQGQSNIEGIAQGLATLRAIEGLGTQDANPVIASLNQLTAQFGDLRAQAGSFGIDTSKVTGAEISALRGLEASVVESLGQGQSTLRSVLGLDSLTALSSTLTATFLPKSPAEQFAETRALFEEVSAQALAGDVAAVQRFPSLAQNLLAQGRSLFASGPGFADLFRSVNETLNQLIARQKEVEESFGLGFIETLEKNNVNQIEALRQQIEPLIEGLDRVERELQALGETPLRAA